jgi:murein DD-endopeptidase MepM/ murein hydrolase activator NlpD
MALTTVSRSNVRQSPVNLDFHPPRRANAKPRRPPRRRIPLLLFFLAVAVAVFLQIRQPSPHTEAHTLPPQGETKAGLPEEAPPPPVPEIRREFVEGTIRPGDTITALLGEYFTPQELLHLTSKSREVYPLSKICAGQPYKLCLVDGSFDHFEYDIDKEEQLIIRKEEDDIDLSRILIAYAVETDLVRGTISSSLFEAVAESGETPELTMSLADIFAWDIDFIRDIRVGDSFQALVEKRFRDGSPAGYGKILAAEFTNQGTTYKAFLYQDGDNRPSYYDGEGNSVRKAFLRAPLAFSRISSGFTMRRYHPVTKTWKAHPAIDYAAPTGTPIKTVGDGTITKKGYTRYNGNYIKIRHNNSYETIYLHMSGFGKGIKQGKRVLQGQTIGYVGSTGLATGPHLCFRMYNNGSPVNPNKVRAKAAPPVSKKRMAEFKASIAPLLARLEGRPIHQAQLDQASKRRR